LKAATRRVDSGRDQVDDDLVNETIQVATSGSTKRVHRTPAEKRRIVEATLVAGASIARMVRENGVNANQVFQWRYEHKNSIGWAAKQSQAKLLPVPVVAEPSCIVTPDGSMRT
jgi:transposase